MRCVLSADDGVHMDATEPLKTGCGAGTRLSAAAVPTRTLSVMGASLLGPVDLVPLQEVLPCARGKDDDHPTRSPVLSGQRRVSETHFCPKLRTLQVHANERPVGPAYAHVYAGH